MGKFTFEEAAVLTGIQKQDIIDFFELAYCVKKISDGIGPTIIGLKSDCIAGENNNAYVTIHGLHRVANAFAA